MFIEGREPSVDHIFAQFFYCNYCSLLKQTCIRCENKKLEFFSFLTICYLQEVVEQFCINKLQAEVCLWNAHFNDSVIVIHVL